MKATNSHSGVIISERPAEKIPPTKKLFWKTKIQLLGRYPLDICISRLKQSTKGDFRFREVAITLYRMADDEDVVYFTVRSLTFRLSVWAVVKLENNGETTTVQGYVGASGRIFTLIIMIPLSAILLSALYRIEAGILIGIIFSLIVFGNYLYSITLKDDVLEGISNILHQ